VWMVFLEGFKEDGTGEAKSPKPKPRESRRGSVRNIVTTKEANERLTWPVWRQRLVAVVESQMLEYCMGLVIISNVFVMVFEANESANCENDIFNGKECEAGKTLILNFCLMAVYTAETTARIVGTRTKYFSSKWNNMDLFVLCHGYIDMTLMMVDASLPAGFKLLRALRILKLMRAVRILVIFPELHSMLRGFVSAMTAVFWGFVMIILLLLLWSILAVEVIHKDNIRLDWEDDRMDQYCRDAFSSVSRSILLFFQTLVAGDSWGTCALPVIIAYPGTFCIFAGALVCVQLGFTNLILAVICEAAQSAHESDIAKKLKDKAKKDELARKKLGLIIRNIDEDESGMISMEEVMKGYENDHEFQVALEELKIDPLDFREFFETMTPEVEEGQEAGVECDKVVDCLRKVGHQDPKMMMTMMRLQLDKVLDLLASNKQDIKMIKEGMGIGGSPSRSPQRIRSPSRSPSSSPKNKSPQNGQAFQFIPLDSNGVDVSPVVSQEKRGQYGTSTKSVGSPPFTNEVVAGHIPEVTCSFRDPPQLTTTVSEQKVVTTTKSEWRWPDREVCTPDREACVRGLENIDEQLAVLARCLMTNIDQHNAALLRYAESTKLVREATLRETTLKETTQGDVATLAECRSMMKGIAGGTATLIRKAPSPLVLPFLVNSITYSEEACNTDRVQGGGELYPPREHSVNSAWSQQPFGARQTPAEASLSILGETPIPILLRDTDVADIVLKSRSQG